MSRSRRGNTTLEGAGAAAAPTTSAAASFAVSPRHEAGSFVQAEAKLEQDYRQLKKKNRKLQNENTELKQEMEDLRRQNIELQEVVKMLATEKTNLEKVHLKLELEKQKWNEVRRKVVDLFSDPSDNIGDIRKAVREGKCRDPRLNNIP